MHSSKQSRLRVSSHALGQRSLSSILTAILAIALVLPAPAQTLTAPAQSLTIGAADESGYLNTIKALTVPAMEGRGAGTPGLTRAAQLLEQRYRSLGLQPAGTDGYRQPFSVVTGAKLAGDNHLRERLGDKTRDLKLNEDF